MLSTSQVPAGKESSGVTHSPQYEFPETLGRALHVQYLTAVLADKVLCLLNTANTNYQNTGYIFRKQQHNNNNTKMSYFPPLGYR